MKSVILLASIMVVGNAFAKTELKCSVKAVEGENTAPTVTDLSTYNWTPIFLYTFYDSNDRLMRAFLPENWNAPDVQAYRTANRDAVKRESLGMLTIVPIKSPYVSVVYANPVTGNETPTSKVSMALPLVDNQMSRFSVELEKSVKLECFSATL